MERNIQVIMQFPFFSSACSLRDPGFGQILAFDFYDGPEHGLAVFPSGEGLRFSVIGESRSRLFRAFSCSLLEGDWGARIVEAYGESEDASKPFVMHGGVTQKALQLEQDAQAADAVKQYIAVGRPYLDMISAMGVSHTELEQMKLLIGHDAFLTVHSAIKRYRKYTRNGMGSG